MKRERFFALVAAVSVVLAGTGAAMPFADEGPFLVAQPDAIVCTPAAGGDRILWIELTTAPEFAFFGTRAIHAYNTTSGTATLIRSRATNARSPDIDGDLAVWEEERGTTTDIVLYNFRTGTVSALHTTAIQHNPRVSDNRIVWEEGFEGERSVWMYDMTTGSLYGLSTGKNDCFTPDIDGTTVVWVEQSDRDAYSIVSADLVSGRRDVLGVTSVPVSPRIDEGMTVWEDEGLIHLASTEDGVTTLTGEPAPRSGAIIGEAIVAWSEEGRIICHDLLDGQTTRTGKMEASTKPAILEDGIAWVEEGNGGVLAIRYQPFASPHPGGLQVEPAAVVTPVSMGTQGGRIREGECAWYALDVSAGTTSISLDFSWENVDESLSCTLIGPGGAMFRFTDSDDEALDGRIRVSVTSPAGIIPGRWYCAVSGESVREDVSYAIVWYESGTGQ